MLCAKCHKNEATIHFTAVVDGKEGRSVHLCKDCAPPGAASLTLEPKHLEALSVTGRNCEFCGRAILASCMRSAGFIGAMIAARNSGRSSWNCSSPSGLI